MDLFFPYNNKNVSNIYYMELCGIPEGILDFVKQRHKFCAYN